MKELYIEESMEGRNPEKRFTVELSGELGTDRQRWCAKESSC